MASMIIQYFHGGWKKWVRYHAKERRILETRKEPWAHIPKKKD